MVRAFLLASNWQYLFGVDRELYSRYGKSSLKYYSQMEHHHFLQYFSLPKKKKKNIIHYSTCSVSKQHNRIFIPTKMLDVQLHPFQRLHNIRQPVIPRIFRIFIFWQRLNRQKPKNAHPEVRSDEKYVPGPRVSRWGPHLSGASTNQIFRTNQHDYGQGRIVTDIGSDNVQRQTIFLANGGSIAKDLQTGIGGVVS